ncbi:hypothetical protein DTO013E5_6739 [Penicillium roqueforti]|uniref:Genomic scaffold, ProqFM164S04 n=1 Tax=Penicillium roqueforti (strain FM164) TaxID=1365484 RepID=W6QFY9_PENRF|nr:uncharacterized protein LCP9604111_6597 [Penicillium roqueforti]CDM35310.1 unnamed protein product [Penicillium roqueforti FM164]KAF9245925.1 hypothetical protein LCP9604111_6597 [Penicillium roqueforti]KAI2692075.1 hypothetical protein LCP963914a_169 [Penicillium roqueforti]KAI2718006.1 hypothetical protein CBS147318_4583 [Penicillium roqueforti]KAI2737399.1 hypothetical protein DTO012A1_7734 [Penicillium roqueforti]
MAPNLGDEADGKKLGLAKKNRVQDDDSNHLSLSTKPRPRPLTPPLPENEDLKVSTSRGWRLSLSKRREQQSTLQQAQSPLFECLPTEVRLLIWEHYLCSRMLHIIRPDQHKWKRSRKEIVGILCSEPRNFCPCSHHCWGLLARRPGGNCITPMNYGSYYHENSEWKFDTRRADFVPLLQTCRRLYSEVIDMIFQKNTFLFNHTDTIIDFSRTLLPQRLSMIRTLQLSFPDPGGLSWNKCCQILATKLPGLKKLTIHLYPHVTNRLDDWLIPLHQIRQPTVFEVLLIKPWYLDPQWEKSTGLVDAPFRFEITYVERRSLLKDNEYH